MQSSELWPKATLFKALPMSSDLFCSDFLKARHIWTITMTTTKWRLPMKYNKEVTSLWSAALSLVYVCFGSFVFIYFQTGNSCIFFLNTATIAFNFTCKNKCYLKKNSLQRASIYRCWWLYLYEIMTCLYNGLRKYLILIGILTIHS